MPVDMTKVHQRIATMAEEASSYEESMKWLKLKNGSNVVRILPPPPGMDVFWLERQVSYKVGPQKRMILPLRQFGQQCPLQDYIDELYTRGDRASKEEADAMWPKRRAIMFGVHRDDEASGPACLSVGIKVFQSLLAIMADPDYADITDPEKGVDITITVTPGDSTKSGFVEYQVMPKRASSPLGSAEQMEEWLKEDLFQKYATNLLVPYTADYIRSVLAGTVEQPVSTPTQPANPAPAKPAAGKAAVPLAPAKAPAPPSAPKPPAPPVKAPTPSKPVIKYWVYNNGETQLITEEALIADFLDCGADPDSLPVMKEGETEWSFPSAYGLSSKTQKPPTPIPTETSLSESSTGDLQAQLAAIRNQKKSGPSQVSQDLRAALNKK